MRSVIWVILLFVAAVVSAAVLSQNDGLVSIFYGGFLIDTSALGLGACTREICRLHAIPLRGRLLRGALPARGIVRLLRSGEFRHECAN